MNYVLSLITIIISQLVSIYTLSVADINGGNINFSAFAGKKILLVNTSTNSANVAQYGRLEQLYQLHADSLVIIAFPSNSFGNEPGSNSSINSFVHANYNIHYYLASKTEVTGANKSELFNWLAEKNINGMMKGVARSDFNKFLINSEGKLIGWFDEDVDPLASQLQNAISN